MLHVICRICRIKVFHVMFKVLQLMFKVLVSPSPSHPSLPPTGPPASPLPDPSWPPIGIVPGKSRRLKIKFSLLRFYESSKSELATSGPYPSFWWIGSKRHLLIVKTISVWNILICQHLELTALWHGFSDFWHFRPSLWISRTDD